MHQPGIASWTDRALSFVLDTLVIVVAATLFLAVVESLEVPSWRTLSTCGAGFYLVYHAVALRIPRFGFGRSVTGISVVSVQGASGLSLVQAVLRPAVRVAALGVAALIGQQAALPWLVAVPLLVDSLLVALLPRRASLGDLLAGTVVVAVPPSRRSRVAASRAVDDLDATGLEAGP
jgi:uncharacterized RDD family membrane protein YckC